MNRLTEALYGRPERTVPCLCILSGLVLALLAESPLAGVVLAASTCVVWSRWVPYLIIEDQSLGFIQLHCPQTDPEGRPQIWLSFDDGPGPDTLPIVEKLNSHGFCATFFFIGEQVESYQGLGVLLETLRDGGHTVANHSWSHPNFIPLNAQETALEIDQTQKLLSQSFGELTVDLFRPPFGYRSRLTIETAERAQLKAVGWSVNSLDFLKGSTTTLVERVSSQSQAGDILLFHDGRGDRKRTLESLEDILFGLQDRGFRAYCPR